MASTFCPNNFWPCNFGLSNFCPSYFDLVISGQVIFDQFISDQVFADQVIFDQVFSDPIYCDKDFLKMRDIKVENPSTGLVVSAICTGSGVSTMGIFRYNTLYTLQSALQNANLDNNKSILQLILFKIYFLLKVTIS